MTSQSVFKQQKRKNGKTIFSSNWYINFKCQKSIWRRMPGFNDKKLTLELKRKVETLVALRMMNEAMPPEMVQWFQALPEEMRKRLAKFDLVDSRSVAAGVPLRTHLDAFHDDLVDRERTAFHAEVLKTRILKIFDGCRFIYYSDINARAVVEFLKAQRKTVDDPETGKSKRGMSFQTSNFYLKSLKQFCRWMIKHKRAAESPIEFLDTLKVELDRRHDRQVLSAEQLTKLLRTTAEQPYRWCRNGVARAMLYRVAMETGLRRNELRSLSPASIDYSVPGIHVAAGSAKNRRVTLQVIRCELADELKKWIVSCDIDADAPLWPGLTRHTARMLRADLEAAELAYVDAQGHFADFHSLRHSFIDLMTDEAGDDVSVKTAQNLARHSTPELTLKRYSKAKQAAAIAALDALPDLPSVLNAAGAVTRGVTQNARQIGKTECALEGPADQSSEAAVAAKPTKPGN